MREKSTLTFYWIKPEEINKNIIKKVQNEIVKYHGLINFASKGIVGDPEALIKAFRFGFNIGVECTKKDVIRIIMEN